MSIDRKRFFDGVRASLFGNRLTQDQVNGMSALLNHFEAASPSQDPRWLAYVLATAFHETARTMTPIEEIGRGEGKPYGQPDPETGQTYFGRGFVQLTWRANYAKQAGRLGVDLVSHPELALHTVYAGAIAVEGMVRGDFTGAALERYFGPRVNDPRNARRIINGMDCADAIAGYHAKFLQALTGGEAHAV